MSFGLMHFLLAGIEGKPAVQEQAEPVRGDDAAGEGGEDVCEGTAGV